VGRGHATIGFAGRTRDRLRRTDTRSACAFRPRSLDGVVCLAGTTSSYAIDPYDEYVFAAIEQGAMRAMRRGLGYDASVGDVLRWDPVGRQVGVAPDGGSWRARLLLVELPTLRRWVLDEEERHRPALAFGDPVVYRPDLAARLLDVHARLEADLHRGWDDATATFEIRPSSTPASASRSPNEPATGSSCVVIRNARTSSWWRRRTAALLM